jgi:nucleoside phosphorylase
LEDYSIGIAICVGIAGGLSKDLNIGDVCHSGTVMDLLDNAKISKKGSKTVISFSPEHYETPRLLSNQFRLNRVVPDAKPDYDAWRELRYEVSRQLLPTEFTGKEGRLEFIQKPAVKDGLIACGNVSADPDYNEAVRAVDRRVLAIETESSGLFEAARNKNVSAITVRGISDYAGIDKTRFERETNNEARGIAAHNAMSYLASQLASPRLRRYFDDLRATHQEGAMALQLTPEEPQDKIAHCLEEQREIIDARLRELAAGYELLQKGYRLPVPRIKVIEGSASVKSKPSDPMEIRDALRERRVITLSIPKEYPDQSLSWIIASDLLTAEIGGKVAIPSVIEAKSMQRPRTGVAELACSSVLALENDPSVQLIFVIDEAQFSKRTRIEFLQEQIEKHKSALFVIVTRSDDNIIIESSFNSAVQAARGRLCEVSFSEITLFIQKNYEMNSQTSEVLAARLWELFHRFQMPTHRIGRSRLLELRRQRRSRAGSAQSNNTREISFRPRV